MTIITEIAQGPLAVAPRPRFTTEPLGGSRPSDSPG